MSAPTIAASTPSRRATWVRRVGPVASGGAIATAAAIVALNDPAAPGSAFPGCVFRQMTGLWCPGCGLTRGTHQLLTGHPLAAIGTNLFTPLVVVAIVAGWALWTRSAFTARPLPRRWTAFWQRLPRWWSVVLVATVVVHGVLRNIDATPFTALAP